MLRLLWMEMGVGHSKGQNAHFGHKNGVKAVREAVSYARKVGIKVLTLYAFSSENWNRPKKRSECINGVIYASVRS